MRFALTISKNKAVLKVIVDILAMLIGAEGARLLREYGTGERRGGSPNRPRKAKRLERKSTGKFNTAKNKKASAINANAFSEVIIYVWRA